MYTAAAPSTRESFCAWYGDARGGVLYFGESAFWAESRAGGGSPKADLRTSGPEQIGRFDLATERFLPPLPTARAQGLSGTWAVLAHPNGRVYYTTFFGDAGFVDPATGHAVGFEAAGFGLAELALGPEGRILASRYGRAGGGSGSVVVLEPDGRVAAEFALRGPPGWRVAPKTVAYDPVRNRIWVTTDLLPQDGGPARHDARVLDARSGRELRRIDHPEIEFVRFTPRGWGYLAERDGPRLLLQRLPPGAPAAAHASGDPEPVILDDAFPASDFVQDLRVAKDGSVLVTRWSGALHRVAPDGRVRTERLPRPGGHGLYYTAVLSDGRVCATYCAGVRVVCAAAP